LNATVTRDASAGSLPLRIDLAATWLDWLDAANAHRYGGYELLNLRASWRIAPEWSATVRVSNAPDRDYADRADFAFGSYRYFPGRPRAVFAEVDWKVK
jgi:iron complex outermembrane receptor protein